ncbi:MAG: phenylalanine--tRNA ligase subunit beta [Planctomycetes bacterium]|nr:phenylalanine--tRNA ligase subunit beta [Planctomycetota bacterium]
MKVSINWLSQYVDIDGKGPEEVADILSELGFPLEGIEYPDGDSVIDIEVTSNRGDCLSYIGIAREVAAACGAALNIPSVELPQCDKDISEFVDVAIEEPQLCARYTARVITGVTVGPSPDWLRKPLEAVGLRSVNNVVDAGNFAMLETGQPPHAFDYDKLGGKKIIVRKGVKGERLVSIDETKCDLDNEMLVIADENTPVAIAGVMGGLDTEVSASTTTILLEEACFDPVCIRTTSRKLTLSSESSFRFERHVDRENIDWASQRTADLIIKAAGGQVARGVADVYPEKIEVSTVDMRFSRMKKLLGIDISQEKVKSIFQGLDLCPEIKDEDIIQVTVPSWRHDIYREVDLIEEVIRSHGYGNIPVEKKLTLEVAAPDLREKLSCGLRSYLNGCGFFETVNVTFTDEATADVFAEEGVTSLSVKDESRKANLLRQTLLGSLMTVYKSNHNAGNLPCSIFELADTFRVSGDNELCEKTRVAMVSDCDLRQIRGVIEGVVALANKEAKVEIVPSSQSWSSAAGQVVVDGKTIGVCGVVSDKAAGSFGLGNAQLVAAELDFDELAAMQGVVVKVKPLPRFPAIDRDLSLIVEEKVSWAEITAAVKSKAPAELEDICFAGMYRGKPIEAGKKSVTVSLRFRDEDGTLRHDIVDGFEAKILGELKNSLNAELRTV